MKFNGYICDRCGKPFDAKGGNITVEEKIYDYCPSCASTILPESSYTTTCSLGWTATPIRVEAVRVVNGWIKWEYR